MCIPIIKPGEATRRRGPAPPTDRIIAACTTSLGMLIDPDTVAGRAKRGLMLLIVARSADSPIARPTLNQVLSSELHSGLFPRLEGKLAGFITRHL